MKREDVVKIFEGATEEQINNILDLNSADIGKAKGDYDTMKADLKTAREAVTNLTGELNTLKEQGASAEDWKSKFETLQNEIAEKDRLAQEEKLKAEREANISKRFDGVVGEKKFTHEAIKQMYLNKFSEALGIEENAGKSDIDIFNELTKDDATAFENVQILNLQGGKPLPNANDDSFVKSVMGIN